MSLSGPGSSVDEYIKFMNWILNADPVSSLQIAGVRSMSPSMRYVIMRGLEYLAALQQAKEECGARDLSDKCLRETVERRTGVDFETVMNGIKNLNTVSTSLRALSKNAQQLIARVTKYILLGEQREVRYEIGGWLRPGGMEIAKLTPKGRGEKL